MARRVRRNDPEAQVKMWDDLRLLQEAFPNTKEGLFLFAQMVITATIAGSPTLNRTQKSILTFLLIGGRFLGIQASRGMTKTVMAAIFCCFSLIHDPTCRVIVFSQNGKRAKEIAGWVIKIFYNVPVLEVMQPDTYAGDRSSVENFDVHWCFRGGDKSPSVTCYSIESGAQGARADLILADDVESLQNSRTAQSREWLMEQSLEFESINQYGRIIYLGTPQCTESIYNALPARGYKMRIWPGRYPTVKQMEFYEDRLAPMFLRDIENNPDLQKGGGIDGTMGRPTTPAMYTEEDLQDKELKQGLAKFMLQFMVHSGLNDAERYKLKLESLIVAPFNIQQGPIMPIWNMGPTSQWQGAPRFATRPQDKFYEAMSSNYSVREFDLTIMYVDPSGGGSRSQDEMGYSIISLLGTYIYIQEASGVKGGYDTVELLKLVNTAKRNKVAVCYVEENYGKGAHLAALKPLFEAHYPECRVEGVMESGQKELRIIDTIQPLLGQHRIVVSKQCVLKDYEDIQHYPADVKLTYSLFYQMAMITSDRGALRHDDRLDALSGAIRQLVQSIDYDQARSETIRQQELDDAWVQTLNNPETYVKFMRSGETTFNPELSQPEVNCFDGMF